MLLRSSDHVPPAGPLEWLVARGSAIKWIVVAAAILVNALKGVSLGVSTMTWPFWAISYRHGFIRRGLAGTVFQSMARGLPVEEQRHVVLELHFTLLFALAAGLWRWSCGLAGGGSPRARALLFTGTAAVFLSALFPTLGATAGYLDLYVLALACAAGFLAFRRRPLAAGLVAMVGPLVHDAFFFLWLPVIGCAVSDLLERPDRRRAAMRLAPLALPLLVEVVVLGVHSSGALARNLDELPGEWRNIQVFELPLREALARMTDQLVNSPEQVALAALFFGWPAAVAAGCAVGLAPPGRRRRRIVIATIATLSPCTILFVAWDLSRFLVWSSYGAFLVLCWSARAARESADGERAPPVSPRSRWLGSAALASLVVYGTGGPLLFSYFDYTFADYNFGPSWVHRTPAARISYVWLGLYNRKMLVRTFSNADVLVVKRDALVETPSLLLARGTYTARIEVAPLEECSDATGELAVHLRWRLAAAKPSLRFDAHATRAVSLDFTIDPEEEAMGRVRVGVTAGDGCLRVLSMTIEPRRE